LTGLGSAVICRVFWGAIKRNLNWLWKKISETVVPDTEDAAAEDAAEDAADNN
jgi:hypothetical protein